MAALYAPLYWWRATQDRKLATTGVPVAVGALSTDGVTDAEPPVAG